MSNIVPVMVSYGVENSHNSFQLSEVPGSYTLGKVLEIIGPDDWGGETAGIVVKVSNLKSSSYDKFSLSNSVDLVMRILKTDVLWVKFEKPLPPKAPVKNAFDILRSAQVQKRLPEKLSDPFNQKLSLFNTVLDKFAELGVGFPVSECAPRLKNKKTGAATEFVYDISDILWRIKMAETPLIKRSLWSKLPDDIKALINVEKKAHDTVAVTQASAQNFALHIREVADRSICSDHKLGTLRISLLRSADIFADLADLLKIEAEKVRVKRENLKKISSAAEAVVKQIGDREKVSLLERGTAEVTHPLVTKIMNLFENESYKPINLSTMLPTNRYSRSTFLHRTLPNQIPTRAVLWSFDNGRNAPQSIFAFIVPDDASQQDIFDKVSELKPQLLYLQKFYFPREFYHQFYDQAGSVTGISKQNFKLLSAMVMGDSRKMPGDVQKRFEEAFMSCDPDFVYDLRFFNGREVKFKEFLSEFRAAVEEYMVEDRGRHEEKYGDTVISRVSCGFSLKSVFEEVCQKVHAKNPNCPLPKSEKFLTRYLIPRTKAAAESVSTSEPLIPLKLAMQQKVIEKPNCDAYYNAALFKYIRAFAVELGNDKVTMIGWDDKAGVDVGEPDQPTAATQNPGKSWMHSEKTVGEGQHSFHKTNLTPSVRLIHELPEDMDGSFYRGQPQVCIKDAIFEHSTSSRHATELLQMFHTKPEFIKPVLILTNDGGVDHTIRHSRNVVAMLAIFLHCPQVLMLINFQMAAYRSAYHPVEKLNCILNLAWNGVCLSRESLKDPVLEKGFAQCSSMADARKLALKHCGLKESVKASVQPCINKLEERARQGSLKGNYFETFCAATDEEIEECLAIVKTVDEEFDVKLFLDKKKTYNYSPKLKAFLDDHVTFTHYAITFKRYPVMSVQYLSETLPHMTWTVPLEPVPCPVLDSKNAEKFLSYKEIKEVSVKDYEDSYRPGKHFKTPANIPFSKNKQRAMYGSQIVIVCDICRKRRVVYFKFKPSNKELSEAKLALKNTRYVCGGRVSGFGRSLAVMEEITGDNTETVIEDEIDNTEFADEGPTEDHGFGDDLLNGSINRNDVEDEINSDSEGPVPKKSKKFVIDSDSESSDQSEEAPTMSHDGVHFLSPLVSQDNEDDGVSKGPCSFCALILETGHRCKLCSRRCCNLCNKVQDVDDMSDVVCPECDSADKDTDKVVVKQSRGRGRPKSVAPTGKILIPLQRRARGRPRNVEQPNLQIKQPRGRPRKILEAVLGDEDDDTKSDENNNTVEEEPILTELRIIGSHHIFSKLFVSEALTCDDPLESHLYDILEGVGHPLPCFYCGEDDQKKIFSVMEVQMFPLCKACKNVGRGAAERRKSRVIKPKPIKPKKIKKQKRKTLRSNLLD